MPVRSAGILLHRRSAQGKLQVLLVHPGGPFWARRDDGVWGIPKGEIEPDEDELVAARREFSEELGLAPPDGPARDLGEIRQRSGKRVRGFALEGELDVSAVQSNTCEIEWPPRSGRRLKIAEVDEARWFGLEEARVKLLEAQRPFLDRLEAALASSYG